MIQVRSRDEAIEWAKRCPGSDNEMIEIRQVQEMSDFDETIMPAEVAKQAKRIDAGLPKKGKKL
jgi:hypothetical protein